MTPLAEDAEVADAREGLRVTTPGGGSLLVAVDIVASDGLVFRRDSRQELGVGDIIVGCAALISAPPAKNRTEKVAVVSLVARRGTL